ncbi:tryptophan halogenase family protein [Glaciecola siphonariae]|uniref:Tryptophan halogenase family protein n=1 Tax=Glaciecola siphonariae TaxID=521012 RepID=A0ABV9LYE5_9ALTE
MSKLERKKIVIAGGGTSGWLAAAALSKQLSSIFDVVLIESDDIGTIGVGEATIPTVRVFHKLLGISEQEFVRETNATFKLGINFENWRVKGESYFHSFGKTGKDSYLAGFQHFWLYGREQGLVDTYGDYCFEFKCALNDKFATSEKANINYAYHLDAGKYAQYLRKLSEKNNAQRIEGKISAVNIDPESGNITSLTLDSGQNVEGDLFIDCTGFKALLIEDALKTGYEDWSHWLPCDRAWAVQTTLADKLPPYTRAIAHESGWQWRIPLQNRAGNGLVFSTKFMDESTAKDKLIQSVDGELTSEPRLIKFLTGRRSKVWNKNCVALGLSSGFIEPLESTSIHLFMTGIIRLLRLLPNSNISEANVEEYNKQTATEIERIRDFIVLHYHVNERDDSDFWRYLSNMEIPESLKHRIELFEQSANVFESEFDVFQIDSWVQVLLGQGVLPKQYHPSVKAMQVPELDKFLNSYKQSVEAAVQKMPKHKDFISHYR